MSSTQPELGVEDFSLEAPSVVGKINPDDLKTKVESAKKQSDTFSKIEDTVLRNLDNQVDTILKELVDATPNSKEMKDITTAINKLGDEEIEKSSSVTNRMMQRPLRALRANDTKDSKSIASSIKKLRGKVTELDPKNRGGLFTRKKILGIPVPFGNKINSYMQEFKSSETQLNEIINSLMNGKDELLEDNATIEVERENLHVMMQRLEQYAYIIKELDAKLSAKIEDIEKTDKLKANDIKQEILFPVRQKSMDIYQHLAVCMQSYMSLQVVKKNNQELIRGVDRATKTTVSALRTAIIVSEALGTQKLVLTQINSVNEATNQLLETNSALLGQQGLEIQKQASETGINVEVLEKSFQSIFNAMDAIDSYREKALPNMKKTVESLESSINNAKKYLTKNREERLNEEVTNKIDDTNTTVSIKSS